MSEIRNAKLIQVTITPEGEGLGSIEQAQPDEPNPPISRSD